MALFSSIGKLFGIKSPSKVNLTPDISYRSPLQIDPELFTPLKKRALTGIEAGQTWGETPGIGYGPEFVERATSPVASAAFRNYQTKTIPGLREGQAARGMTRSSFALKEEREAATDLNEQIDNLMAQFYVLNETQKKTDISERTALGGGLLESEMGQANLQAAASERLAGLTAQDKIRREAMEMEGAQRGVGTLASGLAGMTGAYLGMSGMSGLFGGIAGGGGTAGYGDLMILQWLQNQQKQTKTGGKNILGT